MGHVRHKYTRTYILKEDSFGNQTPFGIEGVEDFRKGGIREADSEILKRLNFKGMDVLEFGFGRGEAIKYATDNGARRIVGVDFSEDANEVAKTFLNSYGIKADLFCQDSLEFLMSYAERKDSEPFNIVLMLDFVEHVPRTELKELLILLRRVLAEKAVIAINTPVFGQDNDVILEGIKPGARDLGDDIEETEGMHCNRYTKESLESFMKDCGYLNISGHFFLPTSPNFLEGNGRQRWAEAFRRGSPIQEGWEPSKFEYAYTSFELYKQTLEQYRQLQERYRQLQESIDSDKRIKELLNSWSWKITAPIRKLHEILKINRRRS